MVELVRVLRDGYGVGPMHADSVTVLWAAESLARARGVDAAKRALSAFNEYRGRIGLPVVVPPYGSPLF
jgi:hypothetical protein